MGTPVVVRKEILSSLDRLLYSPCPNQKKSNKYGNLNNNPGKRDNTGNILIFFREFFIVIRLANIESQNFQTYSIPCFVTICLQVIRQSLKKQHLPPLVIRLIDPPLASVVVGICPEIK